jgi:hypothetical protein
MQETEKLKDEALADNIPCKDFSEAIEKGIIVRTPIFTLNGVNYHTFANNLQMICANRYLAYQQQIQAWSTFGMNMEVSKDYINDALEQNNRMFDNLHDPESLREIVDQQAMILKTYREHQTNFNLISAIIEMNSISFISPCENPYVVDWEYNHKKMKSWELALASEGGTEFLGFFWKLSSRPDQRWMTLLVESMKHLAKPVEQMTETERAAKNYSDNLLIMEISQHKKHLDDLINSKSLKNRVKQSRIMSNLLKLKWNERVYSTIFNIEN